MHIAHALFGLLLASPAFAAEPETRAPNHTWTGGEFAIGDQPDAGQLAGLRALGFRAIVNLRHPHEHAEAREADDARSSGLRYFNLPVGYHPLREETVDAFLRLTDDPGNRPTFIHCTGRVRASALWMIRRVLRDGWSIDAAQAEALRLGLGRATSDFAAFAREFLEFRVEYSAGQTTRTWRASPAAERFNP